MPCSANKTKRGSAVSGRLLVGLGLGFLSPVLGGCSYLSAAYVVQDAVGQRPSDTDRRWEACERARTNMIAARDPLEARRWELLREDLNCPTQRDMLERP